MIWRIPLVSPPCERSRAKALERQARLTKPPGSLGQLESLAVRLAALQGTGRPQAERFWISVFAADHGIAGEGVSAFPQAVTRAMVRNFVRGGAAISVLARQLGAPLEVVDVGILDPVDEPAVISARAGRGTANFAQCPAMTESQLEICLNAGRTSIERARAAGTQIFIGGEMGIGNTTAASALACALLDVSPEAMAGPGTGLDSAGIRRKREVIARALELHAVSLSQPRDCLRCLGGFEIAALAAAYLYAAAERLPVLLDGFIAGVAALAAVRLQPACRDYLIFSHRSGEPGHRLILEALEAAPLLDLSLRLGEGSGAAAAAPLLRAACALHNEMATFAEAGVPTA
jgi:nicotinate-nucleotide--dimethylbenzimidazole phosphoribosyltransferase